jgi:hypothetical protein
MFERTFLLFEIEAGRNNGKLPSEKSSRRKKNNAWLTLTLISQHVVIEFDLANRHASDQN